MCWEDNPSNTFLCRCSFLLWISKHLSNCSFDGHYFSFENGKCFEKCNKVNLSWAPAHQIMCAWGKKVSLWLSIPPEGCQLFPYGRVTSRWQRGDSPMLELCWEGWTFLSMYLTSMCFFPKKLRKQCQLSVIDQERRVMLEYLCSLDWLWLCCSGRYLESTSSGSSSRSQSPLLLSPANSHSPFIGNPAHPPHTQYVQVAQGWPHKACPLVSHEDIAECQALS